MVIQANITPEVLFWARDTAGWTIEDVVKKLNQKKVDIANHNRLGKRREQANIYPT